MLNWIENVEFTFYNFIMSMNQLSGFFEFKNEMDLCLLRFFLTSMLFHSFFVYLLR